jgi:predicted house-cleaning NTP pyrophosphatase (Maf/HAM1 superfamily)
MIDEYVSSGAWKGKAGAYNLSERIAAGWPLRCEGDETTVMGLPMLKLLPLLRSIAQDDTAPNPDPHGVLS